MRQTYRQLTEPELNSVRLVKDEGQAFWNLLDALPPSRELSLAKTKIEEAVMWAVKAITG